MGAQIDWQSLVKQAWAARQNAYSPYSQFAVGAALLSDAGAVFVGCNIENASLGLTICAERVAISAAVAGGSRKFSAIAVVAETPKPITPCGACRQVLAEFSPEITVYCIGQGDARHCFLLSELLPERFSGIPRRAN